MKRKLKYISGNKQDRIKIYIFRMRKKRTSLSFLLFEIFDF